MKRVTTVVFFKIIYGKLYPMTLTLSGIAVCYWYKRYTFDTFTMVNDYEVIVPDTTRISRSQDSIHST